MQHLFHNDVPPTPASDALSGAMPQNVWLVGQSRSRDQRKERYPAGKRHSQKMVPELARKMIEHHRLPTGSHIYDPFLGVGTTVVEGIELGYVVGGCDISPECVEDARKNQQAAFARKPDCVLGCLDVGDARSLTGVTSDSVDAVVTSPPYGDCDPTRDSNGRTMASRVGTNGYLDDNLHKTAHAHEQAMFLVQGAMGSMGRYGWSSSMFLALAEIKRILKPGKFCTLAVRSYWSRKAYNHMIDLPGITVELGRRAGLVIYDEIYAMDAAIDRFGVLKSRGSMHQNRLARQMQDGRPCPRGVPGVTRVLVFQKKPKKSAEEPE